MAQTRVHRSGQRLTRVTRGWGAGEDQPGAGAQLTLKAIITPEQKRHLRYAAFDQGKSVSKIIRALIDRCMAEDNAQCCRRSHVGDVPPTWRTGCTLGVP